MQDQRQYLRFNIEGVVAITVKDAPERSVSCSLVDISFKGIGCVFNVATQEQLKENLAVRLELTTPFREGAICGEGVIRYVTPMQRRGQAMFRIGIEFGDINAAAIQEILARIQQQIRVQSRTTRIVQ
ncbi:MAG: PilZ domain-containing protein [Candidatus Omnitrophica bacterium]|nr:PilZ domain-containing protein [Candidatus Omnitrophota bacterium]